MLHRISFSFPSVSFLFHFCESIFQSIVYIYFFSQMEGKELTDWSRSQAKSKRIQTVAQLYTKIALESIIVSGFCNQLLIFKSQCFIAKTTFYSLSCFRYIYQNTKYKHQYQYIYINMSGKFSRSSRIWSYKYAMNVNSHQKKVSFNKCAHLPVEIWNEKDKRNKPPK